MELTSSLWALYNDLSWRLCRSVFLGRKFQEETQSDKTASLFLALWTGSRRRLHTFFHNRLLGSHPLPISACRSWMALWASHKQLSQFRQWRAEDKEYHRKLWTRSFAVGKLLKVKLFVFFVWYVYRDLCWLVFGATTEYYFGNYKKNKIHTYIHT